MRKEQKKDNTSEEKETKTNSKKEINNEKIKDNNKTEKTSSKDAKKENVEKKNTKVEESVKEKNEDTVKKEKKPKKEDNEISEEKLNKIKDEIKKTKKEIKDSQKNKKIRKDILRNLLIAITITIYFIFINLGIKTIPVTEYILDLKTFSVFAIIISIIIFERAYKKDENYLAIHGIEMVLIGIETLVLLQLYSVENEYFYYILLGITLGMIIYYMIKSLVIYIRYKIKND